MVTVGFAVADSIDYPGNYETLKARILAGSPPNIDDPEDQAYKIFFAEGENIIAAGSAAANKALASDAIFQGMTHCYVIVGDNEKQLSPEVYEKYFKK